MSGRRAWSLVGPLALVCMAGSVWLFYPGLVTYDSILQYEEAATGHFTTIHPPLMAALWRLLLNAASGALPMLVLEQFLYWTCFAVLGAYCIRASGRPWSALAVFAGLWPLLLSFSGVIWKDVLLGAAWGLACGLILLATQEARRSAAWLCTGAAAVLLIFGAAMRHNSATAGIVLAAALAAASLLRRYLALLLFCLLAGAVCVAVPLSSRLFQAEESHPVNYLVSWDLTGISYFSGKDYRGAAGREPAPPLDCYSPRLFDSCPLVTPPKSIGQWADAIRQEPSAYLKHRALVFSMLMRFGCRGCRPYIWESGNRQLPTGLEYRANGARLALGYVPKVMGYTPLGRPYVWLTAALGFAGLFWRRRPGGEWLILVMICLSGAVYALTYFAAAVTDEFRYIYWLIFSVVIAGTAYLFGAKGSNSRDLIRFVIVPVSVVVLLDCAVQISAPTDQIAPSMTTNY